MSCKCYDFDVRITHPSKSGGVKKVNKTRRKTVKCQNLRSFLQNTVGLLEPVSCTDLSHLQISSFGSSMSDDEIAKV